MYGSMNARSSEQNQRGEGEIYTVFCTVTYMREIQEVNEDIGVYIHKATHLEKCQEWWGQTQCSKNNIQILRN